MNRKELERKHYDTQARRIDLACYNWESGSKLASPALRGPYEFCEEWLAQRCQNKVLLDYGCGHGIHSIFPAKIGAYVIGTDISAESLRFAKERAIREGVEKRTSFRVGDCEALEFDDDYFDIIFSSGTLSCLDLRRAYSELARVLKPDGHVIIVDTLRHNPLADLSRRMKSKRGLRTQWTVDHILSSEDLYMAQDYFDRLEIHHFNLLATLAIASFARVLDSAGFFLFSQQFSPESSRVDAHVPLLVAMTNVALKIDEFLLRLPFLQKYAFKAVCILAEPKKQISDIVGIEEGR